MGLRVPGSVRRVAVGAAAGAVALLAYAHLIEPRWLKVERWTVRVPGLPPAWEGMRVVHLTDPQLGMWLESRSIVPRAVATALALKPDLVLITGDFMQYGRWDRRGDVFAPLARAAPTYAVLGNHDYFTSEREARRIAAELRAQGMTMLRNEHAPFAWRGTAWTVVGIDDLATGHADFVTAVTGIPQGRRLLVLLTHVPDAVDHVPDNWFPLVVAGHTHGAQVRISPLKNLSWLMLRRGPYSTKYPRGWFEVGGGLLYVNRGLGLSELPIRFMSHPEVALLVLTDGRALPEGKRWQAGEPDTTSS